MKAKIFLFLKKTDQVIVILQKIVNNMLYLEIIMGVLNIENRKIKKKRKCNKIFIIFLIIKLIINYIKIQKVIKYYEIFYIISNYQIIMKTIKFEVFRKRQT